MLVPRAAKLMPLENVCEDPEELVTVVEPAPAVTYVPLERPTATGETPLEKATVPVLVNATVLPGASMVTNGDMLVAVKGTTAFIPGMVMEPEPVRLIESPVGVPWVNESAAPLGISTELPTKFSVMLVPAAKLVPEDSVC